MYEINDEIEFLMDIKVKDRLLFKKGEFCKVFKISGSHVFVKHPAVPYPVSIYYFEFRKVIKNNVTIVMRE
jgi:hypothetical protein